MILDKETQAIYTRVATEFANKLNDIFTSEETLKDTYTRYFANIPFDRTERWNTIFKRELRGVWEQHGPVVKASMTPFDENRVLYALTTKLDFNLFTQVYLNLQPGLIRYSVEDSDKAFNELTEKWAGKKPSPFDMKPKMFKNAASQDELDFNRDLSTVKALRLISGQNYNRSFRVSPKGSTPALTDSENLSMLGVGGDQYLVVPLGMTAYYITWDEMPYILFERDGKLSAFGIPYLFESKSGGEILNGALYSRLIMANFVGDLDPDAIKVFLPRMASVLLLTNDTPEHVQEAFESIGSVLPAEIKLHEGVRSATLPAQA